MEQPGSLRAVSAAGCLPGKQAMMVSGGTVLRTAHPDVIDGAREVGHQRFEHGADFVDSAVGVGHQEECTAGSFAGVVFEQEFLHHRAECHVGLAGPGRSDQQEVVERLLRMGHNVCYVGRIRAPAAPGRVYAGPATRHQQVTAIGGGTQESIQPLHGAAHRRIGEVVLDGVEPVGGEEVAIALTRGQT